MANGMARLDLLITGFGPYPRVRVNPTERLARTIAASGRWRRLGLKVGVHVFETSYAAVRQELPILLDRTNPRACLHLGLAPRTRWLRLETVGRGNPSRLAPDRKGKAGRGGSGEQLRLSTTAPAACLLAALRRSGMPTRLSNNAGRYLCDTLYHASLLHAHNAGMRAVVFIHIPRPTPPSRKWRNDTLRFSTRRLSEALHSVALRITVASRTRASSPGKDAALTAPA